MGMTRGNKEKERAEKLEEENMALKGALAVTGEGSSEGGSALDQELKALLLGQLRQQAEARQADQDRAKERKLQSLKQQGDQAEKLKQAAAQLQSQCSHLNRGEPRTGGQWNSDGYYNIFCLFCDKMFSNKPGETPCPPHLWPTEDIGGAVMESVNRVGTPEAVQA